MTIAAQLDPSYIGQTCYARIRDPAAPENLWDTSVNTFVLEGSISTADDMTNAGTISPTGYFTATEPSSLGGAVIATATIHHREGVSPAYADPTVAITTTHVELSPLVSPALNVTAEVTNVNVTADVSD